MTLLNGCHNKPRPAPGRTLLVQDGYHDFARLDDGSHARLPRYRAIPDVFDASVCAKGTQEPDAGCTGCKHSRKTTTECS